MTYGGVEIKLHAFLMSALNEGEWSASRPGCFIRGELAPDARWMGDWLVPQSQWACRESYAAHTWLSCRRLRCMRETEVPKVLQHIYKVG
jgi:hypothetical protein